MIILCIGQAGCQIGNSIIEHIDNGCYSIPNSRKDNGAPIIFVDIDFKVIRKLRSLNQVIAKHVKSVNIICGNRNKTRFRPYFSKDDQFVLEIILHLRDEVIKQNYLTGKI